MYVTHAQSHSRVAKRKSAPVPSGLTTHAQDACSSPKFPLAPCRVPLQETESVGGQVQSKIGVWGPRSVIRLGSNPVNL